MVDYKIISMVDGSAGIIAKIRIYSGAITTKNELNDDGVLESVTRYRRTSIIGEKEIRIPTNEKKATIDKILNAELDKLGEEIPEQTKTITPNEAYYVS